MMAGRSPACSGVTVTTSPHVIDIVSMREAATMAIIILDSCGRTLIGADPRITAHVGKFGLALTPAVQHISNVRLLGAT